MVLAVAVRVNGSLHLAGAGNLIVCFSFFIIFLSDVQVNIGDNPNISMDFIAYVFVYIPIPRRDD